VRDRSGSERLDGQVSSLGGARRVPNGDPIDGRSPSFSTGEAFIKSSKDLHYRLIDAGNVKSVGGEDRLIATADACHKTGFSPSGRRKGASVGRTEARKSASEIAAGRDGRVPRPNPVAPTLKSDSLPSIPVMVCFSFEGYKLPECYCKNVAGWFKFNPMTGVPSELFRLT
jgi:hypothetical protein